MISGILITCIVLFGIIFLPACRDFLHNCSYYTERLRKHRLDALILLTEQLVESARNTDKQFMALSHGLIGVGEWFYALTVLTRLLQVHVMAGRIKPIDAWRGMRIAFVQLWFSAWSLPESFCCLLWRDLPHVNAQAAFKAHLAFSIRMSTLCRLRDDTPECVFNDGLLL